MGIAGAALATSISKFIEMILVYVESLRENRIRLRMNNGFKRPGGRILKADVIIRILRKTGGWKMTGFEKQACYNCK